jgi:AcrR family transcriptional regulator
MGSRTEIDTRERLLRAGDTLARRVGFKALTVRAISAKAGAHLGSFVHHFGTRDAFVAELIERRYAPMFGQLQLAADQGLPPLPALRAVLTQLMQWLVQNRAFVAALLADAAAGEKAARRFLAGIDSRHPALLLRLIRQAQAAGSIRRGEPLHQMLFLMSSLSLPVLALQLLGHKRMALPGIAQSLAALAFDGAAIEERLNWALRGLAPAAEVL